MENVWWCPAGPRIRFTTLNTFQYVWLTIAFPITLAFARPAARAAGGTAGAAALWLAATATVVLALWSFRELIKRREETLIFYAAAMNFGIGGPEELGTLERIRTALAGVILVWAFSRMMAQIDELQRRINFEALAFAFTATLLACLAYSLFAPALPALQPLWVCILLVISWTVGWVISARRYR